MFLKDGLIFFVETKKTKKNKPNNSGSQMMGPVKGNEAIQLIGIAISVIISGNW